MITTGSNPRLLKPGIQALFGLSYAQYPELYSQVFDVRQSTLNFEEVVNVNGLGLPSVKQQANPVKYADMGQGFISRFQNITYALGYIITWESQQDNLYMQVIKQYTPALARSMKQGKETIAFNVLNNGFSTAAPGATGADGKALFDTAHKKSKGGTFSNTLAAAQDLSEISLEQALIDISGFEDDAGLKIMAQGMKLIIPRQLRYDAVRILDSQLQNDTANHAINAMKSQGVLPDGMLISVYLDDPDAWFIKTDVPEGLIFQDRNKLEISNDNDFDSENQKWKAMERYCVGWADPRGVYGSPGA